MGDLTDNLAVDLAGINIFYRQTDNIVDKELTIVKVYVIFIEEYRF